MSVVLEGTVKEIVVHADRGGHGARVVSVVARSAPEIGGAARAELGTDNFSLA